MTIGNATLLEIFWTAMGILGLIINLWSLNDAVADLRYQEAEPLPEKGSPDRDLILRERRVRERIAWGASRDETIRCVIQLLFVAAGLVSMSTAPVDPNRIVPPISFVLTGAIVSAQILLVAKSVFARRDRHWMIGTLTQREWKEGLG